MPTRTARPSTKKNRPFLESLALPSWVAALSFVGLAVAYLVLQFSVSATVIGYFVALSLLTFFVFGLDKWLARRDRRRVSEFNLLTLSFMGGALGGLAGITVWHHKGHRKRFRFLLPAFLFAHVAVLLLVIIK